MASQKSMLIAIFLFIILLVTGGFLLSRVEMLPLFDALYITFLTITTVGSAYTPLTADGKMIIIIIIFLGMGTVFYLLTTLASVFIEGKLNTIFPGLKGGFSKMKKMKNHIIICGHGKTGKYTVDSLKKQKAKYIIIEKDEEKAQHLAEKKELVISGNALNPHILEKANISKAKTLVACLPEDSDNIYLIMTASDLNPNLVLAARARDEEAVARLHKVGAQVVVLPEIVGGKQLANTILEMEKTRAMSTISKKDDQVSQVTNSGTSITETKTEENK